MEARPGNCTDLSDRVLDLRSVHSIDCPGLYTIGREIAIERSFAEYGEEALKKFSKKDQWKIYHRNFPKKELIANLKFWLVELTASVNVKQSLTRFQIDEIAKQLYELHSWKATDLILFFRNIKGGLYGGLYENLSPDKVMEWARLYLYDRAMVGESVSESEAGDYKAIPKLDQKIIDKIFKGVGEGESPEVLRKRESTFCNGDKAFRSYLKNVFSAAETITIFDAFSRWEIRNDLLTYCDEAINCIKAKKVKDDYKTALEWCQTIFKIRNGLPGSIVENQFAEVEELRKKLANFITQNKTNGHT